MEKSDIAFYGSTNFSLKILEALVEKQNSGVCNIKYVVTQPEKKFGRKQILQKNPVHEYALSQNLKVITPLKLNKEFVEQIEDVDIAFVAAYGKIIGRKTLNTAKYCFLNFHGSILPKYRGAVPVQLTVLNQEKSGGITVIKMDEGMDTGDMIMKRFLDLDGSETSGDLMSRLASVSAEIVDEYFVNYFLKPDTWSVEKQDETIATYCYVKDFTRESLEIKNTDSVKSAHGKIMAGNPAPKAFINIDGNIINLLKSKYVDEETNIEDKKQFLFSISKKLYLTLDDGALEIL